MLHLRMLQGSNRNRKQVRKMKADCPVCNQTCEGDTPLSVALALVQHIKSMPDDPRHMKELSDTVEQIDREINFCAVTAQDDSAIRKMLYDKCVSLASRLQTLYLYATTHLTLAAQISRDLFSECKDTATIREQMATKQLWDNLRESLNVAERKFR